MKKIVLSLLATSLFVTCFGQDYKKNPALGISYVLYDFKTGTDLRSSGLAYVLRNKQWHKDNFLSPGLALNYFDGLTNYIDFAVALSGAFVAYPVPNKPLDVKDKLVLDVTATVNLKATTDRYLFTPYAIIGLGASKYKGYYGAFIPAGIGLQLNFFDEAYLFVSSQYRIAITENANYHLYHSVGLAGNLFKKKKKA